MQKKGYKRFLPLTNKILVKPNQPSDMFNKIFLPEDKKNKPNSGVVLAVGPDVKLTKPGNKVYFDKFNNTNLTIDDEKLLVIKEEYVYLVEGEGEDK
jgi:co-chaperonin GroES (HSP10)